MNRKVTRKNMAPPGLSDKHSFSLVGFSPPNLHRLLAFEPGTTACPKMQCMYRVHPYKSGTPPD